MGTRWSSGGPCVSVTLSDLDRGRLFFTPLAFWTVGLRHSVPKLTFKKLSRNTRNLVFVLYSRSTAPDCRQCPVFYSRKKRRRDLLKNIHFEKNFVFFDKIYFWKMFFRRSGSVFWRRVTESSLIQGFWCDMLREWNGTIFWPEKNMRKPTSLEMFQSIPSSFRLWQEKRHTGVCQTRKNNVLVSLNMFGAKAVACLFVSRASHEKNHHSYGIIYGYGRGAGSRLERAHVGIIVKLGSI